MRPFRTIACHFWTCCLAQIRLAGSFSSWHDSELADHAGGRYTKEGGVDTQRTYANCCAICPLLPPFSFVASLFLCCLPLLCCLPPVIGRRTDLPMAATLPFGRKAQCGIDQRQKTTRDLHEEFLGHLSDAMSLPVLPIQTPYLVTLQETVNAMPSSVVR
jgi:hypothetical protein